MKNALHESLKKFLNKKGFISDAQCDSQGFGPDIELAYKSYAEHKLGQTFPFDLPANLEQVPVRILDDADWEYLAHLEESEDASAVEDEIDGTEVIGANDDEEEEEEDNTETGTPNGTGEPAQDPAPTENQSTGDTSTGEGQASETGEGTEGSTGEGEGKPLGEE